MSKGISRRIAAFCSVVVVSGFAGLSTAHAASPTPTALKATASVRLSADGGPVVKLGQAVLEEYTVTPGGIAVIRETVPGAGRQVQALPAKPAAQPSGRKA